MKSKVVDEMLSTWIENARELLETPPHLDEQPIMYLPSDELVIDHNRSSRKCKAKFMDEMLCVWIRKCKRVVGSTLHLDEQAVIYFFLG